MSAEQNYESLKRSATRGVAWTGLESVLRQVIQITGQLALARLLAPSDFGILGMALVFQGIAQLVADFGIGAAVVQRPAIDRLTLSSAFWANLAVAGSLTALLLVSAPVIGDFYGSTDVVPVLQVMSLTLLIGGLRTLPRSLLYRDMAFGVLARTGVVASLLAAIVAVTMAATGFGLWSLVAQPVVGNVAELVLLLAANRWRPRFEFRWAAIRDLAQFSYGVLGTNLLNYASRNADNLLIGRFLGSGPLGYYALAYQIMLYPLAQVSGVIVKVLFPTMARLQGNPDLIRAAFLSAISAIAIVTFPMMVGLFAVSHDFILVVFGPQWLPMDTVLRIFCAIGLLQSIGTTVGTIYLSTGNTKLMFRVTAYATPVIIGGFAAGLPWGIDGVALAYGIVSLFVFFALSGFAFRLINLPITAVMKTVFGTVLATFLMYGAVELTLQMANSLSSKSRLGITIFIGVLSYVAASFLVNRSQTSRVLELLIAQLNHSGVSHAN